MNWQTRLLSPEGRMSQKDFWMSALVLFVAWVVSHAFHVFAFLIWLLLIFMWVCVYAKRLHDFGKSGWLTLLPFIVGAAAVTLGLIFGGLGAIGAVFAMITHGVEPSSWATMFAGFGIMAVFLCIAALAKFIFLLWVGLSPGDPGENRYGPPPDQAPAPSPTT
jgi:uncharacterized membrane protein YhaH (DUF805 family)